MAKYGLGLSISDGQTLTIAEGMALPITDSGTPTPDPVQPSGLSLSASGSTSIVLTFTGGTSDVYTVQYRSGTGSWLTYSSTVTTPSGTRTVTISGLTASTTYQTRVANNATPGTYVTSSTVTTDASTPSGCLWTEEKVAKLLDDVETIKTTLAALDIPTLDEIVTRVWTRSSRTVTGQTAGAGFSTTQNITAAVEEIVGHGDLNWMGGGSGTGPTPAEFWNYNGDRTLSAVGVNAVQSGLAKTAEVNAARDAILNRGNTYWVTATGYATPADVTLAINQIIAHGDETWTGGGGTGGNAPTAAQNAAAVWQYTADGGRTLSAAFPTPPTPVAIANAVWNRESGDTRTLTTTFPTVPSAADNAQAVWGYNTGNGRTMTLTTQQLAAIGAAVLSTVPTGTEGVLTLAGLLLAALNADSGTSGTADVLTVRKPDGSTFVQIPLRTEPVADAKIISGIGGGN